MECQTGCHSFLEEDNDNSPIGMEAIGKLLVHMLIIRRLKTNFATEILAESALQKADELDAYYQETGQLAGPLHGIPISVKVCGNV